MFHVAVFIDCGLCWEQVTAATNTSIGSMQ